MKSKITVIEFPVLSNYQIHVEVTSDLKKALAKYPQTKNIYEEEDITTDAMAVHVNNDGTSFIFLPPNASAGTIAHECWHVVRRMMDYLGIELGNEVVAYYLGYLVNRIFRFTRGK